MARTGDAPAVPDSHPHAGFVLDLLPPPPNRVVEVGCGPDGGFVPALRDRGDDALGIDPVAPEGPAYRRVGVEDVADPGPVGAVVACVSLHHVADLDRVLDRVAGWLAPGGTLVVLEWAWERFDGRAAEWCFDRLPTGAAGHDHQVDRDDQVDHDDRAPGPWLQRHRDGWRRSGRPWEEYLRSWAEADGLHTGSAIRAALDARFAGDHLADVPYFFPDLPGTSCAQEQAALDAGRLPASAFLYRGHPRAASG
jgi:SAM-dependent methyltransferase